MATSPLTMNTEHDDGESYNNNHVKKETCHYCQKSSPDLKRCIRCKNAQYCNRECQKAHWSEHKKVCHNSASDSDKGKQENGKKNSEKEYGINIFQQLQHGRPPWEYIQCFYCKIAKVDLLRCTQCKVAKYCDKDCQGSHWSRHKRSCKKYAAQVASGVKLGENTREINHLCLFCDKAMANVKKCSQCAVAEYCTEECEVNHRPQHREACKNFPLFSEMMAKTNPVLDGLHECQKTSMIFPPLPHPNPFIEIHLLKERTPVLLQITGRYHHYLRPGVYVQDVIGNQTHVIFYHDDKEELELRPKNLSQLLEEGNFYRWFHPRWRFFVDGTVGFRIDSLSEIEFIPKPLQFSFPKFHF